jgi:hypothetical protein
MMVSLLSLEGQIMTDTTHAETEGKVSELSTSEADGYLYITGVASTPAYLVINAGSWAVPNAIMPALFIPNPLIRNISNGLNLYPYQGALSSNAIIVMAPNISYPRFLITNRYKMRISSAFVSSQFQFHQTSQQIIVVPQIVIDYIPSGPDVG